MSLTQEQIKANLKKYIDTATSDKFGFMTPELQDFLGVDFIKAPASTATNLHNCFEGGLIDHTLRVMKHAYRINTGLEEELQVSMKSLIKVVYLHGLGKMKLYIPTKDDWRRNKGMLYEFNEELTSMRVGERSALYALKHGVKLTDDEYIAIINFDKVGDSMSEWHNSTVGEILRAAIKIAIMEEKFLAKK